MEFKFRAIDEQASIYIPPPNITYFTEQALRAGYINPEFGRANEFFQNPTRVHVSEAIQREIEKERIREEIIAEEMARRRVLEAEVRREMQMEREMALRRGDGFSYPWGSPASSSTWLGQRLSVLHEPEGRSVEERLAFSLEERLGYSASLEVRERLPFQRCVEPKISEFKPHSEISKEKVGFLAKPDGYFSGAKRKAVTPPVAGASELPSVGSKKKLKQEWSCALCQVSATNEQGLNEHLQGKKHKAREDGLRAQRAGKNFTIGLFPKKTGNLSRLVEITDNPNSKQGEKLEGESPQSNRIGLALLQKQSSKEDLKGNSKQSFQINLVGNKAKKKNADAAQGKRKTGDKKKKKFKYWCEMCQVGAFSEKVMECHRKGKKHVGQLQELNKNGGTAPATQMAGTIMKVNDSEANELLKIVGVEAENSRVAELVNFD